MPPIFPFCLRRKFITDWFREILLRKLFDSLDSVYKLLGFGEMLLINFSINEFKFTYLGFYFARGIF